MVGMQTRGPARRAVRGASAPSRGGHREERRPAHARRATRDDSAAERLSPIRDRLTQSQKLEWIADRLGGPEVDVARGELLDWIVEQVDLQSVSRREVKLVLQAFERTQSTTRAQIKAVLEAQRAMIMASLMPRSVGIYVENGLFKIKQRKKPARVQEAIKKGAMVLNKFTGEEAPHAGRPRKVIPAKVVCRVSALRQLQQIANGE